MNRQRWNRRLPPVLESIRYTRNWQSPQGALGKARQRKRGGVRVIYYHMVVGAEIHFLFIYGKKDQADLTAEQRKIVKKYVEGL
jgi:hypothetical protein